MYGRSLRRNDSVIFPLNPMPKKAQYDGTAQVDGAETKMLVAFNFSDIGGSPRTIMAHSQEEANEIASKLAEDIKKQEAERATQAE